MSSMTSDKVLSSSSNKYAFLDCLDGSETQLANIKSNTKNLISN